MCKNKDKKESTEWAIVSLSKKALSLEFSTVPGRINAIFGILLVLLAVALTFRDWIIKIILAIVSMVKTWILKENIVEAYETTDTTMVMMLTIGFFIVCFVILFVWENNVESVKRKSSQKEKPKGL